MEEKTIKAYKARLNCGSIVILSKVWHLTKHTAKKDAMEVYNSFTYNDRIRIREVGYDEIDIKD